MKITNDEILGFLAQAAGPQSTSDIINGLNLDISERTVRRKLSKLVEEGLVELRGQYRSRKYQIIRTESPLFFSQNSQLLLEHVKKPIYQRDPCTYNEEWFSSYIPNEIYYLSSSQREELHSSSNQGIKDLPAATYARKIFNRLLVNLSYNSSRLEGNTYSLIETEKLLIEGHAAENKLDAEKVMIINHKEAIRFLVDGINHLDTSVQNIRTLHYLLSDGLVAPGEGGQIRKDSVRVSATTYIPLDDHKRLTRLLAEIIDKASKIQDPYEQSIFLLIHISYLQAFIDVNKRTARLAANIPLVRQNLAPLSFNDVDNDDYISAIIVAYELNETGPLSELYVWTYMRSAKQYTATAASMGIDETRIRFRQQRRDVIANVISKLIVGEKIEAYVKEYALQSVPDEHRNKFIADTLEDISALEPFNIAGMGISQKAFGEWQTLTKKKT